MDRVVGRWTGQGGGGAHPLRQSGCSQEMALMPGKISNKIARVSGVAGAQTSPPNWLLSGNGAYARDLLRKGLHGPGAAQTLSTKLAPVRKRRLFQGTSPKRTAIRCSPFIFGSGAHPLRHAGSGQLALIPGTFSEKGCSAEKFPDIILGNCS